MPITFVNASAKAQAANGNLTLSAPASPQVGDVWILVMHSSDQIDATITGEDTNDPNVDWKNFSDGNGGGTTSRRELWWFRYMGANPTTMTVTRSGGQSPVAGIAAFRGVLRYGDPIGRNNNGDFGTGSATVNLNDFGTVSDTSMIIAMHGAADDNSVTTLPTGFTAAFEDATVGTDNCYLNTLGTPDGSVGLYYKQHTGGDVPAFTLTMNAADPYASYMFELLDDVPQPSLVTPLRLFPKGKISKPIRSHLLQRGLEHFWLMNEGGGRVVQNLVTWGQNDNFGEIKANASWGVGGVQGAAIADGDIYCNYIEALDNVTAFTILTRVKVPLGSGGTYIAQSDAVEGGVALDLYTNGDADEINCIVYSDPADVAYNMVWYPNDGNWHRYAMVFNGNLATPVQRLKLYVDGINIPMFNWGNLVDVATPGTTSTGLYFGYNEDGGINYGGMYGDTRIYSRALSTEEIQLWTINPYADLRVVSPVWEYGHLVAAAEGGQPAIKRMAAVPHAQQVTRQFSVY